MRPFVRPSVTPYLEIRAADFDDFCTKLHLDESKKCSKQIFEKKFEILAKNGQIFVLNNQNFAISEFYRHIEYDFLKEEHHHHHHRSTAVKMMKFT